MSQTINCPFCHEDIPKQLYKSHVKAHTALREDGQQQEYVTLPLEEREHHVPNDTPRLYRHLDCNAQTRMPEEIVASYLKNPYLYTSNTTFCARCREHVPDKNCEWIETGENLQSYMDNLRKQKPHLRPSLWKRIWHYLFC